MLRDSRDATNSAASSHSRATVLSRQDSDRSPNESRMQPHGWASKLYLQTMRLPWETACTSVSESRSQTRRAPGYNRLLERARASQPWRVAHVQLDTQTAVSPRAGLHLAIVRTNSRCREGSSLSHVDSKVTIRATGLLP